ncbi:TIM barrel protein [Alphaproteobacteria bacterium GH1-50]|uniref:TIM barrel protein n=1 Tax=Kangsaoukella pontilimi TaxID=2691042 RepID=A0A7C9MM57_9RHOB|nr:sugar phosphate isomerase/epimerase [Kangsaoukella pontilimi]MXQ09835.1 TIM barrel protein [Kangsaoukella pontilimi]
MREFSYQLYSSRNFGPLPDTLAMLAEAGYSMVEGYGALFADDDSVDMIREALDTTGLRMPTAHFGIDMLTGTPDRALAVARKLGVEAVFAPYLAAEDRPSDAAGWAAFGKRLAEAGKPVVDAGLRFGWHNHDFEFQDIGGDDLPIDLIAQASPDIMLELDLAWVAVGGHDPVDWIGKYSDRILSAHIKDIAPKGENADEDGWADVGHGTMDWPAIFSALDRSSAAYFVIEHDNPSDDRRFATRSLATVNALQE